MMTTIKISVLFCAVLLCAASLHAKPYVVRCVLTQQEKFTIDGNEETKEITHEIMYYFHDKDRFDQNTLSTRLKHDLAIDTITINEKTSLQNGVQYTIDTQNLPTHAITKLKTLEVSQQLAFSLFCPPAYGTNLFTLYLGKEIQPDAQAGHKDTLIIRSERALRNLVNECDCGELISSYVIDGTVGYLLTDYTDNRMGLANARTFRLTSHKSDFITHLTAQIKHDWIGEIYEILPQDCDLSDTTSPTFLAPHYLFLDVRFLHLIQQDEEFKKEVRSALQLVANRSPQHRARLLEVLKIRKEAPSDQALIAAAGIDTTFFDFFITDLKTANNQSNSHHYPTYTLSPKIVAAIVIGITATCGLAAWLMLHTTNKPSEHEQHQTDKNVLAHT